MTERSASTSDQMIENIRQQIQGWLMEERWSIAETSTPATIWAMIATDPLGRNIVIAQNQNHTDQVILHASVNVNESHRAALAALSPEDRANFMWDLTIALLKTNAGYVLQGDPLEGAVLEQRIYYDALTKDELLRRVSQVLKVLILVVVMVRQMSAEIPSSRQLGFQTP